MRKKEAKIEYNLQKENQGKVNISYDISSSGLPKYFKRIPVV